MIVSPGCSTTRAYEPSSSETVPSRNRFRCWAAPPSQPASHAAGWVYCPITQVHDLHGSAPTGPYSTYAPGDASEASGALAVGNDPLFVDDDRVLHLVDLDAVAVEEAGGSDAEDRQPAVRLWARLRPL